ncbi:MAG: TetR/AcrR family transcriptional regulator [Eubacteriaceae bacterium]
MGRKGANTKKYIIEVSKKLFAEKGYSIITMKHICEACNMSRGGVYRHFSSTKEIFIAILDNDIVMNRAALEESLKNDVPATIIFDYFLKNEMGAIMNKEHGIFFAIHEFAFVESDQRQYFKKRLRDSIELLSAIFEYGQNTGEFKTFDIEVMANHVLYLFDSLKTTAPIFTPTREMIEKQICLIKELVI